MITQHLGGKKMKKLLGILMLAVLALVIPSVSALDVSIDDVDINGIDMDSTPTPTLYVERGEDVSIRVQVLAAEGIDPEEIETAEDLRVKAWISGYEYGEVEDMSGIFDLDEGLTVVKYLDLEIPEDIDSNEEYTLKIEIDNGEGDFTEAEYTIKIESQRHNLNIQDVIFSPGLSLNANMPLFVEVRVENLGDKKEEDIRIEVSIPALGITQVDYIDELGSVEDDEDDDETSDSTDSLFLDLSNAAAGTYTLQVNVEYNNGYDEVTETYDLTITGEGTGALGVSEDVIDVANKVKTVAQGESIVYKVDIANLGNSASTYSAEVVGLDAWATSSVDPGFVLVQSGNTGEIYVYVSAKADATTGQHMFTVKVKEGSTVVKEINLEANVTPKVVSSTWGNVIKGLEVGFIVLLIILVILGIIIAITKMGRGSDETLSAGEGQTYY